MIGKLASAHFADGLPSPFAAVHAFQNACVGSVPFFRRGCRPFTEELGPDCFLQKIFTFVAIKSPPFFVGAGLFFSQKSVAKGKKPLLISIFFCGKGVRENGRSCKKNRKRKRKESAENREFRNVQKDGDRGGHRHKTSSFFQKGTGTTPVTDKIFFIPTRSRTHGSRHRRTIPPNRPVRLRALQGIFSAGHLFTPAGFGQRSSRRRRKIFLRTRIDI